MRKAYPFLTAKQKYFHDFLTFTVGEYTCEMPAQHYLSAHTVPSTNIGTLGKYEQRLCENKSASFIFLIFHKQFFFLNLTYH